MKKLPLFSICVCFAISGYLQAQNNRIQTTQSNGLTTVKMTTEAGDYYVYVPQLSQGATISGSVESKPQGKNKNQEEKNGAYLNGLVVELQGADPKTTPGRGLFYAIPVAATAVAGFIKDQAGKTLGVFELPVTRQSHPQIPGNEFNIPSVGQTGEPIFLNGNADGNLHNSIIRVDGETYTPLAESTDGIFVRPGPDLTGPTHIDVADNGIMTSGTINMINIALSAGNLNLQRGQTTPLQVTVSGTDGLDEPLSILLRNETPQIVLISGGNRQIIEVPPGHNPYIFTTTVTGLQSGSFSVSATLAPNESQEQSGEQSQPGQSGSDRPAYHANNHPANNLPDNLLQQAGNNNPNRPNAPAKKLACNCDQIVATITLINNSRKKELEDNAARFAKDLQNAYSQLQNPNLSNYQREELNKKVASISEQLKEVNDKLKNKVYEEEITAQQDTSSSIARNGNSVSVRVKVTNVDARVCDCQAPKDCVFYLNNIDGFHKKTNPVDSFDKYYEKEITVYHSDNSVNLVIIGLCHKPGCDDSPEKEKKIVITFKLT